MKKTSRAPARRKAAKPARTAKQPKTVKARARKLSRSELVRYERVLLAEKQRQLRQSDFTEEVMESSGPEGTGEISSHRTHTADQGTENYQRELASRFRTMEGETLRAIEDALRKVADGSYGNCERCGAPIPKARLDIVPHARLCMKCLRGK